MINLKAFQGEGAFDPCAMYNWRLNWLENTIGMRMKRGENFLEQQYQRWYNEEEQTYQNQLKDMNGIDRLNYDTAIIIPTHAYQSVWLRACLQSCKETGLYTMVAFDNPFHNENIQLHTKLPTTKTFMMADLFIMKQKTWGSGVGIPHAWNMFYGLNFLKSLGFKYVFSINGDCIMERPEGLAEIREMLDNDDIIACEWKKERSYCGTMSWLSKIDLVLEIWNKYMDELYCSRGNAEARMGKAIIETNAKVTSVENPEDAHFKPPGIKGTWREILGFRHLHAEHKIRRQQKMEPISKEYFEHGPNFTFLNGHEQKTLLKYFQTGDRDYLEAWWS